MLLEIDAARQRLKYEAQQQNNAIQCDLTKQTEHISRLMEKLSDKIQECDRKMAAYDQCMQKYNGAMISIEEDYVVMSNS